MSEPDFWKSTAFAVIQAFSASEENMTRLAYRTAIYQRLKPKNLPKSENEIFQKAKPKRQSIRDQYAMAKLVTQVMSKEVH